MTTLLSAFQESTEVAVKESISLIDLLMKGGYMVVPLALLLVAAIYIFFERIFTLKAAAKVPNNFNEQVRQLIERGDLNGARNFCAQIKSPLARMVEKGISRIGSPLKTIEASIENVGKVEIYRLEKNLSLLATIAGAAPMIGFLGTVTGMIQAFIAIAQEEGQVSPKMLSSGIYEAMITTAVGLFIGIVAYLAYNYLVTRVSKLVHRMEYTSVDFIDLLQEPQNVR
ncbi:MotA/TolQ/ExbB proton channel family protein [Aureibacter tunicatorum]|uniref:Biopolymer transport protein ExbB n=1 Tax=Aureibacter tunicatorum TaxID=866807 RepID=A0AAE3XN99_9BACT|nr:MotA/TolQ/ExbB proton channel family protein [Aureibacter tunicatorum]MDR6239602.1 biopolymer transport protein ExbB [Aureibacter tunicatorum]BDD04079.1 biopolymer transporter ExbB [Aureibacter tunicatorum]